MKHGKRPKVQFSTRAPYTNLPNIEEGAHSEDECAGAERKVNWERLLLKGLKYVLLLGVLVGVGLAAVAASYPGIFNLGV